MPKPNRDGSFTGDKNDQNVPGPHQEFEGHEKLPTTHSASERKTKLTGLPAPAAKDNPRPIR